MRAVILSLIFICGIGPWQISAAQDSEDIRFMTVNIHLDSPAPVAAWQFELNDRNGLMNIVGVENGESIAYVRAPYYDREAVQLGTADRIIVADFSLADESLLPSGNVRIATLHLMIAGDGEPDFDLNLVTATTNSGQVIDASIKLESVTGSEK